MKCAIVVLSLLLVSSANAQPVQQTPSQTAIQINNVINQWALSLEAQAKMIDELKKQLADMQKTCGKPCEPKK